jgi:hypothetical protein
VIRNSFIPGGNSRRRKLKTIAGAAPFQKEEQLETMTRSSSITAAGTAPSQ